MKLLVIQEQHFTKKSNGEVWADKQSDREFWDRYLSVFDSIVVCARMRYSDSLGVKALRSDRSGVSFVGMPDFRGVAGIVKNYIKIQNALKKAIKEADCVIFRAPSPISMVCYGAVLRSNKPFAVELMNNPNTHFSAQSMHHIYQPFIQWMITKQTLDMCKKANGVAYVTNHVLQNLYPSTARLNSESSSKYFEASYSTINLKESDFVKETLSDRFPDGRPNPLVLIHSGEMIDNRKGQDIFIECIAELIHRGYPVKGILIGDGEKRKDFEQLGAALGIREMLDFVGWKSGFKQVQSELVKGHFFVFPSTGEGLPRSVIEAMASGLLCFGSNIDGVPELISEKMLVDGWSGSAFADAIEPFICDWDTAKNEQKAQYNKAKEYKNSILEKQREDFYSKLKNCVL